MVAMHRQNFQNLNARHEYIYIITLNCHARIRCGLGEGDEVWGAPHYLSIYEGKIKEKACRRHRLYAALVEIVLFGDVRCICIHTVLFRVRRLRRSNTNIKDNEKNKPFHGGLRCP